MPKLLTIAIPTFNRAESLDKLLAWLADAIQGSESDCEILVSDNCSTDNTKKVIEKWQQLIKGTIFCYNKNSINIGLMPNFAYCLQAPTSKYVWVIADDDTIQKRAIPYVLQNLKNHPDLSLLLLNGSIRSTPTGEIVMSHIFEIENEEVNTDAESTIKEFLITERILALMSGTVYKTEAIQSALKEWSSSTENVEAQIYWTALCATKGSIKVSKETYFEYASPMFYQTRPKIWFTRHYGDLPEIYTKLMEVSSYKRVCRKLLIEHFTQKNNWKVVLGALRRWPILTINTMLPYYALVGMSAWEILLSPKQLEANLRSSIA